MPTINLFDRCTGLLVLKDIYQIPDPVLRQILSRCIVRNGIYYEVAENGISIFLEETGIHPDTYDVSDVKVHCKHITTAFDNGKSIKSLGFLPLTRLLEEESALSGFLRSNGIIVTPSRYRIEINGKNTEFHLHLKTVHLMFGKYSFSCPPRYIMTRVRSKPLLRVKKRE